MYKKSVLLFLSSMFMYGCVSNIPTVSESTTPQPSSSPTLTPSINPTTNPSNPVQSIFPSSTVSPSVTTIPSLEATPSPIVLPTPVINTINTFSLGLNNPYKRATNLVTEDFQRESREVSENLLEIKSDFAIIDLKQELIDLDYTSDVRKFKWQLYDDIFSNIKDKNIKIYFRINYKKLLSSNSSPTIARYEEFLREVIERYKDYNLTWIIGDSINDYNVTPGTAQNYLEFLQKSFNAIRQNNSKNQVFMGSLVQSEIFGKPISYLADNLLSYINLGADKYCDGFIFKIYSLDIDSKYTQNGSSIFNGTDYKIIGDYYSYINDIIKMKNIQSKKLILETGTYGPDLVDNITQTEQQQANDIFRRVVYANSLGFDNVFLSEYFDQTSLDRASFYRRLGLVESDNIEDVEKKLSYWMYKFISEKLNGAILKSKIENLPSNIQGYLYTKNNKNYYVLWNEDKEFTGNVAIKINTNAGVMFNAPSDSNNNGLSINFQTSSDNIYNASFYVNPLNPRIIETNN